MEQRIRAGVNAVWTRKWEPLDPEKAYAIPDRSWSLDPGILPGIACRDWKLQVVSA
jgi:hypothetical protein